MPTFVGFNVQVNGTNKAVKSINDLRRYLTQLNALSGKTRTEAKLVQYAREIAVVRNATKLWTDEIKAQQTNIRANNALTSSSYRGLQAQLDKQLNAFRLLNKTTQQSAVGKNLLKDITRIRSELAGINKLTNEYRTGIDKLKHSFGLLGTVIAGSLIGQGLETAIRSGVDSIKQIVTETADFQRQLSIVGQVTGAAGSQVNGVNALSALEKKALQLGNTTEFTSAQVAELEVIYGKLGFEPLEILNQLASTLDTATISQEDLANTAEAVGTALRVFSKDSAEATNVADVLAKAFAASALDLNGFRTSIGIVGPAAAATKVPLETMTAQLGILANAGFDNSTAATSLRNVYLRLGVAGLSLSDAMVKINQSTNPLITAFDLVGLRGAAALITLATNSKEAGGATNRLAELTEKLQPQNVIGFARKSADAIRNDYKGAIEQASSATEAFRLAIGSRLQGVVTSLLNAFTGITRRLTDFINGFKGLTEQGSFLRQIFTVLAPLLAVITARLIIMNAVLIATTIANATRALYAYIVSLGLASRATAIFNTILGTTPIGRIITGIAVLTGVLVNLFNNTKAGERTLKGLDAAFLGTADSAEQLGQKTEKSATLIDRVFSRVYFAIKKTIQDIKNLFNADFLAEQLEKFTGAALLKLDSQFGTDFFRPFAQTIISEQQKLNKELAAEQEKAFFESVEALGTRVQSFIATNATKSAKTAAAALEEISKSTLNELEAFQKAFEGQLGAAKPGSAEFKRLQLLLKAVKDRMSELKGETVDYKTRLEALTDQQKKLNDRITDAILLNKNYQKDLAAYATVSEKIISVQQEWELQMARLKSSSDLGAGSLRNLTEIVAGLQTELELTGPSNVSEVLGKLIEAQGKLERAQQEVERAQNDAEPGKTSTLEIDIQPSLQRIAAISKARLEAAALESKTEEELNQRVFLIEADADIARMQQRLRLFELESTERIDLEQQIADKQYAIQLATKDGLLALYKGFVNERFETEKAGILANYNFEGKSTAQIEKLKTKLSSNLELLEIRRQQELLRLEIARGDLAQDYKLQLLNKLTELEFQAQENIAEGIKNALKALPEEIVQLVDDVMSAVGTVLGSVETVFKNFSDTRVKETQRRYDREIELAAGNQDLIVQLEQERDAEVERIQRESFERGKKLQIAQALISGAQAILSTLAAVPGPTDVLTFGVLRAVQVGLVAAVTAAQIAAISSQTFAKGGYTGNSTSRPDHTGQRPVGVVHANEWVANSTMVRHPTWGPIIDMLNQIQGTGGVKGFYATGGSVTPTFMIVNFSDESINTLAVKIGEKVYDAVLGAMSIASAESIRQSKIDEQLKRFTS